VYPECSIDINCWIPLQETLEKKMEIIARRIYGADGIELLEEARKKVELYTRQVIELSLDI